MSPKNAAAVSLGRRGGQATAKNLTSAERTESARKAAEARWARQKAELKELVDGITVRTKVLEQRVTKKAKQK
jgi:hypothetical protein